MGIISFRFYVVLLIFIIKNFLHFILAIAYVCLPCFSIIHYSAVTFTHTYLCMIVLLYTEVVYKNRIESDFTIFCQNVSPEDRRVPVFLVVLMIFDISSFLSLCQSDSVTDFSRLTITVKMKILYSDSLL